MANDQTAETAELTKRIEKLQSDLAAARVKNPAKIAVVSRGPLPRNRGGFTFPVDKPVVLAIDSIHEIALREIENDHQLLAVRSDMPVTPENEVVTY